MHCKKAGCARRDDTNKPDQPAALPCADSGCADTTPFAGTSISSGFACLALVAGIHRVPVNAAVLQHQYGQCGDANEIAQIVRAAKACRFKASALLLAADKTLSESLHPANLPAIARAGDGGFCVVARMQRNQTGETTFLVQYPSEKGPRTVNSEAMSAQLTGELVLLRPRADSLFSTADQFNLKWFVPIIAKYRGLFIEVVIASFFLQLFALVTPLFFQVVMDKVLVHRGFSTLNVLAIGYLAIIIFETVIGGLRNYLFSHTTTRVDVELGARLFQHLVELPLCYFTARQTGQTVARVRELDSLRNFITSSALTLIIDVSFTFIFIAVLWYYSPTLTWIVLGSLPCYILLSAVITPLLRHRLERKFHTGAINQAFVTETVSGMQTVKSQALEPQMRGRWEEQLADYVTCTFRAENLGNIASQAASLISKVVTLLIIWFGAHLVIAGAISVGQLVAFNMIAGRVTGPLLKIVQLWQDFQQAGISLQRLGDILNTPTERLTTRPVSTPTAARGEIAFEHICFRYNPGSPLILNNLSLRIDAKSTVGITGPSGSGKSTIAALLQGLYRPENGRIVLDGLDIHTLDTAWLRAQTGVVQQESFLFNRSVRDNIALANPAISLDAIMHCAKLAGAHDFINALPEAYDTLIGEQGCNLSGGQRQRIAIARALLKNPSVLLLDEATSALDYATERTIEANLASLKRDRTVVIIAHRLSTLRRCDLIHFLRDGAVRESGTHDELIALGGEYAALNEAQCEATGDQLQAHTPRDHPGRTGNPTQ